MSHEPKLTVYTIKIRPVNNKVENSNRQLCRHIIEEANQEELQDSYIITSVFGKVLAQLDQPKMYADPKSKKCITANQIDIEDENVNPNLVIHTQKHIIEGKIEGGTYGKKRKRTSISNKSDKSVVNEKDAITDDFYFLIYIPLHANTITLLLQSYSDDSIDTVMKHFWQNFFTVEGYFNKPEIKKFIPKSIIEDFKTNSTVSSLSFSTEMPGETLLENTQTITNRNYKITVKISPISNGLTIDEFGEFVEPVQQTIFTKLLKLGQFPKKKGTLKDSTTNKSSPFELGSDFEIQPSILLSKYITINGDETDFDRIKQYCLTLLDNLKAEIYPNAIRER